MITTQPAPPQPTVPLTPDHPGFADSVYRARRDAIAAIATGAAPGGAIPIVRYTTDEHAVWRAVWERLAPLHAKLVVAPLLEQFQAMPMSRARIPQLRDISAALGRRTGFCMRPVSGLVAPRRFFSRLAAGEFLSTQYVRHGSRPLYTPEPDVVHELVGHAATLADPRLAALNRRFGEAFVRADPEHAVRIERVYWFTLEFGVCAEGEHPRAVGAGLLSSAGELARLPTTVMRPWSLEAIASTAYDTADYQPGLFVAPSYERMLDDLERWLDRA